MREFSDLERAIHDDLVFELSRRLNKRSKDFFIPFITYGKDGVNGELDLVRMRGEGVKVIYEVKTRHSPENFLKAKHQLKRAYQYFGKDAYCVYVSQRDNRLVARIVYKPRREMYG